jgi:hypothetical protein
MRVLLLRDNRNPVKIGEGNQYVGCVPIFSVNGKNLSSRYLLLLVWTNSLQHNQPVKTLILYISSTSSVQPKSTNNNLKPLLGGS